jgi:ABC-type uncharacterized transport system fused permease/ATPase subunit
MTSSSGDEQQRLILARAILHQPDWLIMDDATAQLDEAMEKSVYDILTSRLPNATLLSITNRPAAARSTRAHWEPMAPSPYCDGVSVSIKERRRHE